MLKKQSLQQQKFSPEDETAVKLDPSANQIAGFPMQPSMHVTVWVQKA